VEEAGAVLDDAVERGRRMARESSERVGRVHA
jgi:hypothetical protein